jgi:hypothetical protein
VTFDQLVDRFLQQFDTDQPTAVSIANERHKRMVAEAEYRLAETSLGNTVAGTSDYALADTTLNIAFIQIGAGEPYIRASERQMVGLRNGTQHVNGDADGAFSFYADADGDEFVRINPTPTASGQAITAWSVIDPVDMTYGGGFSPIIPAHLHSSLLDGMIADGYEQIENNPDRATQHEARYEAGITKLRRHKNARLGGGPTQVVRGW